MYDQNIFNNVFQNEEGEREGESGNEWEVMESKEALSVTTASFACSFVIPQHITWAFY